MTGIRFTSLAGNTMKLDGGAMFGNAPKALWERWMPADEENMILIHTRALLVRTPDHALLFETGAGAYLPPKLKQRFQFQEEGHVLLDSLAEQGLGQEDITHVILSHLHFDHAGGLLSPWDSDCNPPDLLFPEARFVTGRSQFDRALNPHARDRASYIPELPGLLEKSGRLELRAGGERFELPGLTIEFFESHGHTPGMLASWIHTCGRPVVFTGDLIPARPWVSQAITMGYDRFPEGLIDEKSAFLSRALGADALMVYPHDPAASGLARDDKTGRIVAGSPVLDLDMTV